MTAQKWLTAILAVIVSFSLSVDAQEKGKEEKGKSGEDQLQTYDGYGGNSKQGMGPGVSVIPPADNPNEEKVQTQKNKTKKTKPIKKAKGKDAEEPKEAGPAGG